MSRANDILNKIKGEIAPQLEDTPPANKLVLENKEEFEKAVAAVLATVEFAREQGFEDAADKMQQAHDLAMEAAAEIESQMNSEEDPEEPEEEPNGEEPDGEPDPELEV